ncbi:hypothetical protein [Micromonospora echinofusca]|uniref:Uncharacterized protein n=1 Tax=Micromonospora echinofusca TaxID=47858 RepID=A0A1C5GB93_MICEH|nr:hypothetical protein [Micromonospora echinofusca]SCG16376.1 hypothetical protein GA0070610_2638 [Micromonospora echinofusca]
MAFDAERYDREVIKPLRGRHGRLPAGDLAARYAVQPEWSPQQLVAHLAELRGFWRERATGPDSRAEVCRLLISADDKLRRETGDLMNDPTWWREQAGVTGDSPRSVPATPAPQQEEPVQPARSAGPPTSDWRVWSWRREAHDFIQARLDTPIGGDRRRQPAGGVDDRRHDRVGEADGGAPAQRRPGRAAQPGIAVGQADLTVGVLGGSGDRCRVRLSWPAAGGDRVRIRWAATPPPWRAGAVLPVSALSAFGAEVVGVRQERDGEVSVVAEVPVGYHLYVPFLVEGDQATVGRLVALGVAEPVRRLRAERRGDDAVLSWIWPAGARLALVEWTSPTGTERGQVSRAGYASANGFRIPAAADPCVVRVAILASVVADEVRSPVREVALPPRPVRVSYTLARHWRWHLGRREISVRLRAATDVTDLVVTVVLGAEPTMPPSPVAGTVLAEVVGVELHREQTRELTVVVPELPRLHHPYWIRCFVRGAVPIAVSVPPVESMRVS